LEKLDLNPIILHEQPDRGRTIIQKFEDYSDVGFAVILLTPDDIGYKKNKPEEGKQRARQNVIFELGYFIGKLGHENVCALYKEGVELPSDIQGRLYVPMDSAEGWHLKLSREIKDAGIEIDLNRVI
jgi:predicted nucleotide-binding protein